MSKRPLFFLLPAFLVFSLSLFSPRLFAEEEIKVVMHVHSSVSSGRPSISDIARFARQKKIDAVMMTDLLSESYAYGLAPLQNIIKKTVRRKSVIDKGAELYLAQIKNANKEVPEVVTMDGVVATPFYYWTGNIWPGPLVLNDRGKDFLVFGLSSAKDYVNIPVLQTGKSRFDAYHGRQGTAPFQDVIDYVRAKNGFIVWSHPGAEENRGIRFPFGRQVFLNSKNSYNEVANTRGYHAIGIYSVELRGAIESPEYETAASAGGVWDKVLFQYISGRREEPVWAVGEVDYNGIEGGNVDLSAIMNKVFAASKSPEDIYAALRSGNFYIVTPGAAGEMVLNSFTAGSAGMGGTAVVAGVPQIKGEITFAGKGPLPYHAAIIRNGTIIDMLDVTEGGPFTFQDDGLGPDEPAFYRVIAYDDAGSRLLTNPIFVRRSR